MQIVRQLFKRKGLSFDFENFTFKNVFDKKTRTTQPSNGVGVMCFFNGTLHTKYNLISTLSVNVMK